MQLNYEPFSHFFLLPQSLKDRISPLSKLLADAEFFKGNFTVEKPRNDQEFKTELRKIKICSKMQCEFVHKLHLSKKLKQFQADAEIQKIKPRKHGRGRPMKPANFNKKYLKKLAELSKELYQFDSKFFLKNVQNQTAEILYTDPKSVITHPHESLEFDLESFLDYKRKKLKIRKEPKEARELMEPVVRAKTPKMDNGIQVSNSDFGQSLAPDDLHRRMRDVSTTNVCEMIDFGNEIPSICSSNQSCKSFDFDDRLGSPRSIGDIDKFIMNDVSIQTSSQFEGKNKFTQVNF